MKLAKHAVDRVQVNYSKSNTMQRAKIGKSKNWSDISQ